MRWAAPAATNSLSAIIWREQRSFFQDLLDRRVRLGADAGPFRRPFQGEQEERNGGASKDMAAVGYWGPCRRARSFSVVMKLHSWAQRFLCLHETALLREPVNLREQRLEPHDNLWLSSQKTSHANGVASMKMANDPTAAIGSPAGWPVCTRSTPMAKTTVDNPNQVDPSKKRRKFTHHQFLTEEIGNRPKRLFHRRRSLSNARIRDMRRQRHIGRAVEELADRHGRKRNGGTASATCDL